MSASDPRCPGCPEVLDLADDLAFRCVRGHVFDVHGLLREQDRLAARIASRLTLALNEKLRFASRMAAWAAGRPELLRYLRRRRAEARATLDFLKRRT